jgi:hypothetical protein
MQTVPKKFLQIQLDPGESSSYRTLAGSPPEDSKPSRTRICAGSECSKPGASSWSRDSPAKLQSGPSRSHVGARHPRCDDTVRLHWAGRARPPRRSPRPGATGPTARPRARPQASCRLSAAGGANRRRKTAIRMAAILARRRRRRGGDPHGGDPSRCRAGCGSGGGSGGRRRRIWEGWQVTTTVVSFLERVCFFFSLQERESGGMRREASQEAGRKTIG